MAKKNNKSEINKVKKEIKMYAKDRHAHKIGYAMIVVINAVMIWAVSNILSWHIPFLQDSFVSLQWIFTLSFLAVIVGHLLMLIHDTKWFHGFVRLITNSFSFITLISLFFIFPFDFSAYTSFNWTGFIKIILIICILGSAVGIITEFFQLIFRSDYRQAKE